MERFKVDAVCEFLQEKVYVGILVRGNVHELTINLLFQHPASQLCQKLGELESVILAHGLLDRGQNVTKFEDLGHFARSVLRLPKGLSVNPQIRQESLERFVHIPDEKIENIRF